MSTGFATALGEITLVLFTTLAPSGALAFVLMGAALLREQGEARVRINRFLIVPIFVSLIGLVASATHLGNPDNALYVFTQVGHSPLSNEVFAAVVFMGLAGVYWLYQFADRANSRVQRAWLVVAMVSAVAFVAAVAFAYAGRTIVTWNTPFVPVALCLNALVGGPVLAVAGLHAANWEPAARGFGRTMVAASGVALAVNVAAYAVQGMDLARMANAVGSAAALVPQYPAMVVLFAALCAVGLAMAGVPLFRRAELSRRRAAAAAALVYAGIFVMRFAFYMMHMTSGISL